MTVTSSPAAAVTPASVVENREIDAVGISTVASKA
jgi:hypothetical protein